MVDAQWRTYLFACLFTMVSGCSGTVLNVSFPVRTGAAVVGLRIVDTAALRGARERYNSVVPPLDFLRDDPQATLSFGRVDDATGNVDLARLARLRGVRGVVGTTGYGTTFTTVRLEAGRFVTLQARIESQPNPVRGSAVVLDLSGDGGLNVDARQLGGYQFQIEAGEVVYVGTILLRLEEGVGGEVFFGAVQVVDEFAAVGEAQRDGTAIVRRMMQPIGLSERTNRL